jgi:hypothetical protein
MLRTVFGMTNSLGYITSNAHINSHLVEIETEDTSPPNIVISNRGAERFILHHVSRNP